MTIKQQTAYKLWRIKWTREKTLAPGEEFVIYQDQTTGWENHPGRNMEYTTVRVKSDDELTLAYGVPSPGKNTQKPFENPYVKEQINSIIRMEDYFGREITFSWAPGAERK